MHTLDTALTAMHYLFVQKKKKTNYNLANESSLFLKYMQRCDITYTGVFNIITTALIQMTTIFRAK